MNEKLIIKIKNLLSLSKSSNQFEAQVSLLKAQELLAKHKLNMKEIIDYDLKSDKVERTFTDISFTTAKWKGNLASLIAHNFGCYCYFNGRRTNRIVFLGRTEDVTVCKIVFEYALDSIYSMTKNIKYKKVKEGKSTKNIVNDYAKGFIKGLRIQFSEQLRENQEWGLVLQKDPEVVKEYEGMKFGKTIDTSIKLKGNRAAFNQGVKDGKSFSISDKIENSRDEYQERI